MNRAEGKGVRNHLTIVTTLSDSDNGSSVCFGDAIPVPVDSPAVDLEALCHLSDSLSSIFQSLNFEFCADACISVTRNPPCEVGGHCCVLSARSPFFHEVFAKREKGVPAKLELMELVRDFDRLKVELLIGYSVYLEVGSLEICSLLPQASEPSSPSRLWLHPDPALGVVGSKTFGASPRVAVPGRIRGGFMWREPQGVSGAGAGTGGGEGEQQRGSCGAMGGVGCGHGVWGGEGELQREEGTEWHWQGAGDFM